MMEAEPDERAGTVSKTDRSADAGWGACPPASAVSAACCSGLAEQSCTRLVSGTRPGRHRQPDPFRIHIFNVDHGVGVSTRLCESRGAGANPVGHPNFVHLIARTAKSSSHRSAKPSYPVQDRGARPYRFTRRGRRCRDACPGDKWKQVRVLPARPF